MNEYKNDSYYYMSLGYGQGVPDGTVYEADGYYFKAQEGGLINITLDEYETLCTGVIKNVIFLIADGGGYDNLTLAEQVKEELLNRDINKISGAKTEITTNTITGEIHTGTYLLDYLVGSANTLLPTTHGSYSGIDNIHKAYITDSSAAGTALSSGYKTIYCYAGIDSEKNPRASLTELAKMNGKSTGIVSTKSFADATPLAYLTAHSIYRYEYHDNAIQSVLADVDVAIFEGTYYGDLYGTINASDSAYSADFIFNQGYELIDGTNNIASLNKIGTAADKAYLEAIVNGSRKVTKLWGPMLGIRNSGGTPAAFDTAADLISYDIYGEDADIAIANQPSLKLMTQAALKVLENGNNPNGFFIMIESGCLDNAAEGGNLRETIGEYLAFDETFAYCVQWAKDHGDNTLVIACSDHDSGGFYGIEDNLDEIVDALITGTIKAKVGSGKSDQVVGKLVNYSSWKTLLTNAGYNSASMGIHSGHTDMCIPVSMYCPATIKNIILKNMGLPTSGDESTIRTGTSLYYVGNSNQDANGVPISGSNGVPQYRSAALNSDYIIENTDIAHAIAKIANMGSLDVATSKLFVKAGSYTSDGSSATGTLSGIFGNGTITIDTDNRKSQYSWYYPMTFSLGTINTARNTITYNDGTQFTKIGNFQPRTIYALNAISGTAMTTAASGSLFLPQSVLIESNLAYAVNFTTETKHEYLTSLTIPVNSDTFTLPNKTLPQLYGGVGKTITSFTLNGKTYSPGQTVDTNEIFSDGNTVTFSFTVGN
ncbi:MAG: alkaline phosphatase [Eubacteriales bacterium]|nr:alkaline phosphatase [Eubacteriales bacterium]